MLVRPHPSQRGPRRTTVQTCLRPTDVGMYFPKSTGPNFHFPSDEDTFFGYWRGSNILVAVADTN